MVCGIPRLNLQEIVLRPVTVDEESRFKELLDAHHYLGAVAKIGHTIWYVATWQGQWLVSGVNYLVRSATIILSG
jgi:hypothetical protein